MTSYLVIINLLHHGLAVFLLVFLLLLRLFDLFTALQLTSGAHSAGAAHWLQTAAAAAAVRLRNAPFAFLRSASEKRTQCIYIVCL